jgi:hypothetical protein
MNERFAIMSKHRTILSIFSCVCALWILPTGHTQSDHVNQLISQLSDKNSALRENAALELGEIKDTRALAPLILSLADPDDGVRQNAAEALGRINDPRAVSSLIVALKDTDYTVRMRSASALGAIRDERSVEPLSVALTDSDEHVRNAAAFALDEIRHPLSHETVSSSTQAQAQPATSRPAMIYLYGFFDPKNIDSIYVKCCGDKKIKGASAQNKHKIPYATFDVEIPGSTSIVIVQDTYWREESAPFDCHFVPYQPAYNQTRTTCVKQVGPWWTVTNPLLQFDAEPGGTYYVKLYFSLKELSSKSTAKAMLMPESKGAKDIQTGQTMRVMFK